MTDELDGTTLTERLERQLFAGFEGLPEWTRPAVDERGAEVLDTVAARLRDNYPYFHPLYAGQMLKPPHPVAREAYALAMHVNPNNHALDGGRASSRMEKEAVADLAGMFGWRERHLGHLTGGGTLANLEALWVSGRLQPGATLLGSAHAHYTHSRISQVLGLDYEPVAVDARGRLDCAALAQRLARGGVGTVIATLGTTGLGAVDALDEILPLARRYDARVHVDAAYGGYFGLAGNLGGAAQRAFAAIADADSVVIDPHKHGLQPYGCGCVLFADPTVGALYQHDSPYTYFTSDDLHLGEISLECSRAGAAAVALWATQRHLPLAPGGPFAAGLEAGRDAACTLHDRLEGSEHWLSTVPPDLDIVVFAPDGASASAISAASQAVFDRAAGHDLHLALMSVETDLLELCWPTVDLSGASQVTCLRSVLMKPEHREWIDEIWRRLELARHS